MALVPRVKIDGDFEKRPELSGLLTVLALFGERLGTTGPQGAHEAIAQDAREAAAMFDVMRGHAQRQNITGVRVHQHRCPHVRGFEEGSWTACTSSAYGYVEERF